MDGSVFEQIAMIVCQLMVCAGRTNEDSNEAVSIFQRCTKDGLGPQLHEADFSFFSIIFFYSERIIILFYNLFFY